MRRNPFARTVGALAVCGVAACGLASAASVDKKQAKAELKRLRKELRLEVVQARQDIRGENPDSVSGRVTELRDGSFYSHADAGIFFEKLGPLVVRSIQLGAGGRELRLRMQSASVIAPGHMLQAHDPDMVSLLYLSVPMEEGGVRATLGKVVYLPGEEPTAEEIQACLARYPEHDEQRSRLRCGLDEGDE